MTDTDRQGRADAAKIVALDTSRDGFPEPTLLPHLVDALPEDRMPDLLRHVDDMAGGLGKDPPWPRLLSAVCERIGKRIDHAADADWAGAMLADSTALYSHLRLGALDTALERLLIEVSANRLGVRAERICRLAARYPEHDGGVFADLAGAALVDLEPRDAHRASAWFLPLTDGAERRAIIDAWAAPQVVEPDAFEALLAAADYDERNRLTAGILELVGSDDVSPIAVVATLATLLPDIAQEGRRTAVAALDRGLEKAGDILPAWWLALAWSRMAAFEDESHFSPGRLPSVWQDCLNGFGRLPTNSGYADVLRAHPGAIGWMASTDYPGLSTDEATRLLAWALDLSRASQGDMAADEDATGAPAPAPEPVLVPVSEPSGDDSGDDGESIDEDEAEDAAGGGIGGLIRDVIRRGEDLFGGIFGGPPAETGAGSSPTRGGPPDAPVAAQRERTLQADVFAASQATAGYAYSSVGAFVASRTHAIDLSIGRGGRVRAGRRFVEPDFPADSTVEKLDVHLICGDSTSAGTVDLPRDKGKNSTTWRAFLDVPDDSEKIEATVVVLHKGRVLQAATLSGPVVASVDAADVSDTRFALTVTADVHAFADLEARGSFDAAIVTDGQSGAAFAGAGIGVRDLNGVDATIRKLNDKLFKTSESVAMSGDGADPSQYERLLIVLAAHGKLLHSVLIRQLMPELDGADRIQIVSTNPSAILPLEFVYAGPGPTHTAKLCTRWKEALDEGTGATCPDCSTRPTDQRSEIVCPLHFWALSKIIERHAPAKPRTDGHDFYVDARVVGQRDHLAPLNRALFAASDNVPEALVDATLTLLKSRIPDSDDARTWSDWASAIENHAPTLMVSMPHNALDPLLEISTLEIGSGNELRAGEVTRKLVCRDDARVGPVIVLLGCQTAHGGPQPFHTFVGEFRNNGAAIVIGTLASVLGEHAAPVVQAIVRALTGPAATRENTLGDLLLRIRRQMFAEGIVIALAVCAFGDADWALAIPGD